MSSTNNANQTKASESVPGSSRAEAAPGDGRHPTGGLTSGKTAGSSSHTDSDVPAPGNTNLGKGGPTSMSGSDNAHPGAQGAPAAAAAGDGGAGAGLAHSDVPKDHAKQQGSGNPNQSPDDVENKDSKKTTPEQANASGDGTFGDGKFDAAAPGAAAKAIQLEAKARTDAGETGKINVHVN